ncbi:MAG: hypothetical protein ACR2L5_01555 [Candidatus Actinomarinaceae bacterium]
MINYEVGQILYLTNEKTFRIIPVQVVEEVVRTTIDGKLRTYLIKFPDKKETIVDINDIKFKCFKTEQEVKDYLLENTRLAIENLLKDANELKKQAYTPAKKQLPKESSPKLVQPDDKNDIITVDLGGGQKGKFKVENLTKVNK